MVYELLNILTFYHHSKSTTIRGKLVQDPQNLLSSNQDLQ